MPLEQWTAEGLWQLCWVDAADWRVSGRQPVRLRETLQTIVAFHVRNHRLAQHSSSPAALARALAECGIGPDPEDVELMSGW